MDEKRTIVVREDMPLDGSPECFTPTEREMIRLMRAAEVEDMVIRVALAAMDAQEKEVFLAKCRQHPVSDVMSVFQMAGVILS